MTPSFISRSGVLTYAEVEDLTASLAKAVDLGATVVQAPYEVPGATIALFAHPQGNVFGIAQPRGAT